MLGWLMKINCFLALWTNALEAMIQYPQNPHQKKNVFNLIISDIDECREANACGANSLCNNYPGNYTCTCQDGYAGDPYTGVSYFLSLLHLKVSSNSQILISFSWLAYMYVVYVWIVCILKILSSFFVIFGTPFMSNKERPFLF